MANITVIITASTAPIAPTDEEGIDKAVAAMIDAEALATAEEALVEDLVEDFLPKEKLNLTTLLLFNGCTLSLNKDSIALRQKG